MPDIATKRNSKKPYRYITKHGIGPGTLPKDVVLVDWEDLPNYKTAIYLDRPLTTKELDYYDIYPEYIQEGKKTNIFESLTEDDITKLGEMIENDEALSYVLNMFDFISEENKDNFMETLQAMFNDFSLMPKEAEEEVSEFVKKVVK